MIARFTILGAASAISLAWASPVLADVKAGVDAWTSGEYAAAIAQWRGPAASGDADAQFNLAQAYRLGRGVDADARAAETLYAQAAAQGHMKAADNYGLMLFQDGRHQAAMPYILAASQRGDPRAQYLLSIAHFNGDLAAQDWQRAYALITLAHASGLPQAATVMQQMDAHIPREQREQAQQLAQVLKRNSDAMRAVQLAAADLGAVVDDAADYGVIEKVAVPRPAKIPPAMATSGAQTAPTINTKSGPWKVQLGAFAVGGNAQKLWQKLSARAELAGSQRLLVPSGKVTLLLAGGFPSRSAATAACSSLKKSGQDCLVIR